MVKLLTDKLCALLCSKHGTLLPVGKVLRLKLCYCSSISLCNRQGRFDSGLYDGLTSKAACAKSTCCHSCCSITHSTCSPCRRIGRIEVGSKLCKLTLYSCLCSRRCLCSLYLLSKGSSGLRISSTRDKFTGLNVTLYRIVDKNSITLCSLQVAYTGCRLLGRSDLRTWVYSTLCCLCSLNSTLDCWCGLCGFHSSSSTFLCRCCLCHASGCCRHCDCTSYGANLRLYILTCLTDCRRSLHYTTNRQTGLIHTLHRCFIDSRWCLCCRSRGSNSTTSLHLHYTTLCHLHGSVSVALHLLLTHWVLFNVTLELPHVACIAHSFGDFVHRFWFECLEYSH